MSTNRAYLTINGSALFRTKVQPAKKKNINRPCDVAYGEVDILLDFYGALRKGRYFYSSDIFREIGDNFKAISWHSFAVHKDSAISVPKVHFKDGSRRECVDSFGYVRMQEVIAYPVVSVVIKDPEAFGNEKSHQKADVKSVVSFEARDAVCVDLFVLPKGICPETFMTQYDSSLYTIVSTNSVFIAATNHAFEPLQYNGKRFPEIRVIKLGEWSCVFRVSDPPKFTRSTIFPAVSVISYDLKSIASSLLDRTIAYPTDDPRVFKKTTFRERLS